MARYHSIVNGDTIPVYVWSFCAEESRLGELYNGEVFNNLGVTSGYAGVEEIRFLNPNGKYYGLD